MQIKTFRKLALPLSILAALSMSGCESDSADDDGDKPDDRAGGSGSYTINTSGGQGQRDTGFGGYADYFEIEKYGNGDLEVLSSGSANASFSKTTVAGNLGDVPLIISSDTTILGAASGGARPPAGMPYVIGNSGTVYISPGGGTAIGNDPADGDVVTGIEIQAGATLTVDSDSCCTTYLSVDNDIINRGTITTVDKEESYRYDLYINVGSYFASGTIEQQGLQIAQDGGYVYIDADYSIVNHGDINTSGFTGDMNNDGGDADYIYLYANRRVENTGNLTAVGGDGYPEDFYNSGQGEYVELYANWGDLLNSGDIKTSNGDNSPYSENAGYVYFYAYGGDLINSGNIDTSGTDSIGDDGTYGNDIYMEGNGGKFINSGDLITRGGHTTDSGSNGGYGGDIDFYHQGYQYNNANDDQLDGDMIISGNLDTRGGDGNAPELNADGGYGGSIYVYQDSNDQPDIERRVAFLGYSAITAKGGDGNHAGDGDYVGLYNYSSGNSYKGNVTNEADIDLSGGNVSILATSSQFDAGYSGYFNMETAYNKGVSDGLDSHVAKNTGDLTLNGGTGSINLTSNTTARSRYVYIWGYNGVSNTGTITKIAGSDSSNNGGTSGYGGYSQSVELYSDHGEVSNTGDITSTGGDGEYRGGYNDGVYLYGQSVTNSGDIIATGGNADATLTSSIGGYAGDIEISSPHADITNTGTLSNTTGTGETAGTEGRIVVGDFCTGNC